MHNVTKRTHYKPVNFLTRQDYLPKKVSDEEKKLYGINNDGLYDYNNSCDLIVVYIIELI